MDFRNRNHIIYLVVIFITSFYLQGFSQVDYYFNQPKDLTALGDSIQHGFLIGRIGAGTGPAEQFRCGVGFGMDGDSIYITSSGGGGLSDGDYTDIDVSGSSTILTIDTSAVTSLKILDGTILNADIADGTIKWPKLATTVISPSLITGDQDDYNPTGFDDATIVRISGDDGIRAITSFAAQTDGEEKKILNVGSYPIYFPSQHPDGTAANRFITNKDYMLYPNMAAKIIYDGTSSRWRIETTSEPENIKSLFYYWPPSTISTVGPYQFSTANTGTNTATAATTSLPACAQMATSTNATSGGLIYFSRTVNAFTAFGSAHIYAEALISIPTLSDGTETFGVNIGIMPAATSNLEDNNSIYIRYSHGTNSGKWELVSQDNAGAESTADSGITVAAATLYSLRIEIDKAKTEARAYINNIYVGRVTGNLPNSVACVTRVLILKSAGSTARQLNVHGFSSRATYP